MSENHQRAGCRLYCRVNPELRQWFEHQWLIWPERAHKQRTTNLSFHYGGVTAFRQINGYDPKMSSDFSEHVAQMDKDALP